MSKVWFVTGSSRGLGRKIAEAVLAAGDRLVATARDPRQLADLVERYGEQMRALALDVTDAAAAQVAIEATVAAFGRIDVVVNNAGYGLFAPFEQVGESEFRAQIDTNFYGVVNVTRAAVPFLRAQRSGHIIQVSSVGGRIGTPGLSAYQAAKWAVGGFSEVLWQELAPIGVRVTVLEPGGLRTDWAFGASRGIPELLPDYLPSVGVVADMVRPYAGHEIGDPEKVATVVVALANHTNPPLRLLLGSDAVQFVDGVESVRAASAEQWRDVSIFTDVTSSAVLPVLPTP